MAYKDDFDEREMHPSFGMARFGRPSSTPGATLFDSDIRHQHYVTLTIETASRQRGLKTDWIRGEKEILEIGMSEAQFGGLVSSFGSSGVPVTIMARDSQMVPQPEFSSRTQISMQEVKEATREGIAQVGEAYAAVEAAVDSNAGKKALREALRDLRFAVGNLPSNLAFAGEQLSEHVETVVQKARADIEGMVARHAETLGLTAADVAPIVRELTTGE